MGRLAAHLNDAGITLLDSSASFTEPASRCSKTIS
jgi:hypothetical protein